MLTRLSLRNRLLLSLILVASISLVAATLFSIRYFSGKMYAEASRNMRIKAQVAESIFHRSMSELQTFTQTLAIDPPLRLMITHRLDAKIPEYLSEKIYKKVVHVVVFDKQKQEVARIVKGREIPNSSRNPLVSQALSSGQAVVSLQQISSRDEPIPLLVMTATMPIRAKGGQLVGSILVERLLNGEREQIDQIEELLDLTAVLYVEGKPISSSQDTELKPEMASLTSPLSGQQMRYEAGDVRLGGELAEYIPLYDNTHSPVATLGIFQSADAYVQTRDEAILKLLAIMLGCLLLASFIGFALAKSFLEPIHQLSNGVKQISAGDLEHRILLDSRDELGMLAGAFNSMASQLRSSFGKIHDQVQEIEHSSEERERLVIQLQHQNSVLQREISERKRSEEDRQRLEIQVRRIHKLEALGTLAGGVAHDFNNILAIMLMHSEMLQDKVQNEREKRALHRIIQAGERGAELVRQILTFSQMKELERVAIGIEPILKESLDLLRATIPATIAIQPDIQPDCPLILADATQIHQVIVNLCVNAGQAMKAQGGVLEVSLKTVDFSPGQVGLFTLDDTNTYVMLEVKDSGGGILPDIQERIFEPFFTTKAVGEGSGLGLSVVHGIVKSHQGEIDVKSIPGKGTSVQVFFPVADERAPGKQEEILSQPSAPDLPPKPVGSVLIVDDERDLLTLYAMQLTELGYSVTEAVTDGDEALKRFQNDPDAFDLVLTDHSMAGMSGMELSEQILKRRPELPIILITGHSETHIKQEARAKGIRYVLTKPLKMARLKRAIQKTMSEEKGEENIC